MEEKYVIETHVEFHEPLFFDDNETHEYNLICYDGYADAFRCDDNDLSAPLYMSVSYPKLKEVLENEDLSNHVLEYRGLYDLGCEDITFGDIMMAFGKIQ